MTREELFTQVTSFLEFVFNDNGDNFFAWCNEKINIHDANNIEYHIGILAEYMEEALSNQRKG